MAQYSFDYHHGYIFMKVFKMVAAKPIHYRSKKTLEAMGV